MELNWTKAQIAAYEKYPKKGGVIATGFGKIEVDNNADLREGFKEGYEKGMEDAIERAVKWLKENCYVEQNGQLMFAVDTDKFRKAMTEEKQSEN